MNENTVNVQQGVYAEHMKDHINIKNVVSGTVWPVFQENIYF